ncbi:hypothetical protein SCATT_52260 [Streptantibioticus cattleyicolor NRRL 8057 = DSM 46488]|uniref:Uncharacterized protein n=1 Tax=Streptantibioticus cattleyicolor (strain ATCC 35852 / DSM 46488 / JCM 4925 / NBRC 14057 / NRRL 8057) TaxID=1003195 RepID=G8WY59_STREN|nr:hypothetical protein SCATT_52260 [Streptantibioticus cattleyicolor NRRL 8057 = DSM 46488]
MPRHGRTAPADLLLAILIGQPRVTWELRLRQERRRAVALATMGVDYPYTYEGAPFPRSAFAASGVSA